MEAQEREHGDPNQEHDPPFRVPSRRMSSETEKHGQRSVLLLQTRPRSEAVTSSVRGGEPLSRRGPPSAAVLEEERERRRARNRLGQGKGEEQTREMAETAAAAAEPGGGPRWHLVGGLGR